MGVSNKQMLERTQGSNCKVKGRSLEGFFWLERRGYQRVVIGREEGEKRVGEEGRAALLFGRWVVGVTREAPNGSHHTTTTSYTRREANSKPRCVQESLLLRSTPQAPHSLGEPLICSHIDRPPAAPPADMAESGSLSAMRIIP